MSLFWQIFSMTDHIILAAGISLRVIMRRPAPGIALAWLFLVVAFPFVGAIFYLLIGERRVGLYRARRLARMRVDYRKLSHVAIKQGLTQVDWSRHDPEAKSMNALGLATVCIPTVTGSTSKLFSNAEDILRTIAEDVDGAKRSILMEFYIWNQGGLADEVLEAVIRAVKRGVSCRVLVDALGSGPWWRSDQPKRMRDAGVKLQPALPVGPLLFITGRTDLRLHRKIVVIDSRVAWTGSMNLVDPRFFKKNPGLGEWVDAMVRMEGAVVAALGVTMISDWILETGESLDKIIQETGMVLIDAKGEMDVQVIPSGPAVTVDGLLQMLLTLIYSAKKELVLTTPYFVPAEALLQALRGAAGRGVEVHLIVPEKVDSMLTRFASWSYYAELMEVGVQIHLYRGGLLHTKSITADSRISMFGTVNLDMRSLWLNYEVSLFVYCEQFGRELNTLQKSYLEHCIHLDPKEWAKRSFAQRLLENTFRLVGPML